MNMRQAAFFVVWVLCLKAFIVKTNSEEISDKQRMKEAIRLRIMETPLEHMLVDPIISESDLLMGKQVLDKIRTGEPQFVVGLVYNSTIDKVEVIFHMFHIQQLLQEINNTSLKNNLEQSPNFADDFNDLWNQKMIIGTIHIIEATVFACDRISLSCSHSFIKTPVNGFSFSRLTNKEQNDFRRHVTYLLKKQWIQTNGPFCRQLQEKYQAYKKYLPDGFLQQQRRNKSYL